MLINLKLYLILVWHRPEQCSIQSNLTSQILNILLSLSFYKDTASRLHSASFLDLIIHTLPVLPPTGNYT